MPVELELSGHDLNHFKEEKKRSNNIYKFTTVITINVASMSGSNKSFKNGYLSKKNLRMATTKLTF